jgi:REP element-mobilizing transposase RayT
MGHSYTNLLYHLVFSTKERQPWLDPETSARLYDYLGGAIRSEGGASISMNGCPDHIHILAKLRQDKAVLDVHQKVSFKDEFIALLDAHGIEYDEKYLWD